MQQQDLTQLKNNMNDLRDQLRSLAEDNDIDQFLQIIHRPGFTTPAEATLISGVVSFMAEHAKLMAGLKQVLMSGASRVELNPQPLPPGAGPENPKTASGH